MIIFDFLKHLVENNVDSANLKLHLDILPSYLAVSITPLWKKLFEKIQPEEGMKDLLKAMHSYLWNFLDYDLVQYLVKILGNEALQTRMKDYADKMELFKANTNVIPFMKCWNGYINCDMHNYVTIVVKHDLNNCKLATLDEFRKAVLTRCFQRMYHYCHTMPL